jgi:hypothetical protein
MNEANLAIARKVVLYTGLVVSALLFLFPHWRYTMDLEDGSPVVDKDLGRRFIAYMPLYHSAPPYQFTLGPGTGLHIHHVRQFTEVALALLATFGLRRALKLKKPAGD